MSYLDNIRFLFYPRTIAMVGASTTPGKWGHIVFQNIITMGYEGRIYPVNPKAESVFGRKSYKSVAELPEIPDLAVVIVPKDKVLSSVEECGKKGIKACMVITSGFSEAGDFETEKKIAETAKRYNIALAGPNGQGVFNNFIKLSATMALVRTPLGNISLVSQSGNLCNSVLSWAAHYNLGMGKFISSGNEALLKVEDYFEYFANDPDTDVILSYVEGVDEGRRFFEKAKKASEKKPILILKGAKTNEGTRAALSHTGALAGSYKIFSSVAKQAGCIITEDIEEFLDIAYAFASQPLPNGKKVTVISEGGGWAVLAADTVDKEGLEMSKLTPDILEKLDKLLPPWWSKNNPIDLVAERKPGIYQQILDTVISSEITDSVVTLGIGYYYEGARKIKQGEFLLDEETKKLAISMIEREGMEQVSHILEMKEKYKKPIMCASDVMLGKNFFENKAIEKLLENRIFVYPTPQRAIHALSKLVWYSDYLRKRKIYDG